MGTALFDYQGRPLKTLLTGTGETTLTTAPGKMNVMQFKFNTTLSNEDLLKSGPFQAAMQHHMSLGHLNEHLQAYVPAVAYDPGPPVVPATPEIPEGSGILGIVTLIFDSTNQVNLNGMGYQDLIADIVWETEYIVDLHTLKIRFPGTGVCKIVFPEQ